MPDYRFEREARTPHSESYTIDDGEHSLGHVDLHYTASTTQATLAVHQTMTEEAILDLIEQLDASIVSSADPHREDLVVTVWRGEEYGVFADEDARGERAAT